MILVGWAVGLLLGFVLGSVQAQLQGRWAAAAAGLGGLALVVVLIAAGMADSFARGFVLVYLTTGVVLSLLAAVPRLLLRIHRPDGAEALWVSLGLGAALVAGVLLTGLGTDALLGWLLPGAVKAQLSSGLVPGLLVGTALGLGWGWRGARRPGRPVP